MLPTIVVEAFSCSCAASERRSCVLFRTMVAMLTERASMNEITVVVSVIRIGTLMGWSGRVEVARFLIPVIMVSLSGDYSTYQRGSSKSFVIVIRMTIEVVIVVPIMMVMNAFSGSCASHERSTFMAIVTVMLARAVAHKITAIIMGFVLIGNIVRIVSIMVVP